MQTFLPARSPISAGDVLTAGDSDFAPTQPYPIQPAQIDWHRLLESRPLLLDSIDEMPAYLLKPEVLRLLSCEYDARHRLIIDLMWSTGARISETLALTPQSFLVNDYGWHVRLKTLKQGAGRPSKRSIQRSKQRYVPICDELLIDRIKLYLKNHCRRNTDRLFPITPQAVGKRLKNTALEAGITQINVHSHTLRHSFAVHLLLHGRPLKFISKLLGHRRLQSTEIYTNVLASDGLHFMEAVGFH